MKLIITATSMDYVERAVEEYAEGYREGHHDRFNHWVVET